MNTEGIKMLFKKHKTKIVVGATILATGVVGYLLGESHANPRIFIKSPVVHLPMPKRKVGDWEDFWVNTETGRPMGIIRDVHVQFMGELGENIFDHCEDCELEQVIYDCPVNIMFELMTDT